MLLKDSIEQAFGYDAEERIFHFLVKDELSDCGGDTARWLLLFEKCETWRKQFLLWENGTYINGVHGWNLEINICSFRPPMGELENRTKYFYCMTLLMVVNRMGIGERSTLAEFGDKNNNFSAVISDYYGNEGYLELTPEQWLEEIAYLLKQSWEGYQKFSGKNPAYHREMEINYPKFQDILDYLSRQSISGNVVRMNRHGGDDTVWYFAEASDCFYIMQLSDSM